MELDWPTGAGQPARPRVLSPLRGAVRRLLVRSYMSVCLGPPRPTAERQKTFEEVLELGAEAHGQMGKPAPEHLLLWPLKLLLQHQLQLPKLPKLLLHLK